jgi:hypothetical protein
MGHARRDGLARCNGISQERADLLHGYLVASENRKDWAGLNKDAVVGHARQLLRAAERLAA